MLKALKELYNKRDIIALMIELYVKDLIKNHSSDKVVNLAKNIVGLSSKIASNVVTNKSIACAVSTVVSGKIIVNSSFSLAIRKITPTAVFLVSTYEHFDIAANAAKKLRNDNPAYYYALYLNKIEMLYILVDPLIRKAIKYSKNRYADEKDRVAAIIEGLLHG